MQTLPLGKTSRALRMDLSLRRPRGQRRDPLDLTLLLKRPLDVSESSKFVALSMHISILSFPQFPFYIC